MASKNSVIYTIVGVYLGINIINSLIRVQIPLLLQIYFFGALPVIIWYIFNKLNNESKKLYCSVSIIAIVSLNAPYLIVSQNYSINSTAPLFAGLIVTLYYLIIWDKSILINKSKSLIKEYKMEESLPYLDKLLEKNPKNFYALINKASILAMMGEYNDTHEHKASGAAKLKILQALELTDKILEKKPNNVVALNIKAHIFLKLERYDESIFILDNILKKYPKNEFALSNKALILSRQWKYEESLKYFEDTTKMISRNKWDKYTEIPYRNVLPPKQLAEIWFEKGKVHQRLGQHSEALTCFDKALELDPDSEEVLNYKEVLNLMEN